MSEFGVAKLKFHEDWKSIATIVSGKIQNVGSGADPFLLSDPNQWNAVASKDFLMSKSFKLMDDLDFDLADTISVPGGSTKFIPFGGHPDNIDGVAPTVVPFTGNLIANGKKLINIDITSGQNDAQDIGVFRKVGVGGSGGFPTIGYSDDPLVIENLTIDLTTYESNNVGAIGTLENGMANVRVINGNITGSVTPGISSAVGGVVGNVMDGKIMHSSYQGNIDVSGYASVGGIVGFIDGFSSIEKSYSELNTLVGYQEVGGIAGMLQGDLRIQFVYARLKGAIGESGSTQIGGFYGAQGVSSGNYSDILIDYFGNSSLFTNVGGCTNECFAIAQDLGGATAVNIIALTDLNANDSVNIDTSNTIGDNIYIESSAATLNENVYGPFISNSYDAWNWYIVNDQAGTPRLKLKFESGVYW